MLNTSSSVSILVELLLRGTGCGGTLVDRRIERRVFVIMTSLWEFLAGLEALISKFLTSTFFMSFSNLDFLIKSDLADNNPQSSLELNIWIY